MNRADKPRTGPKTDPKADPKTDPKTDRGTDLGADPEAGAKTGPTGQPKTLGRRARLAGWARRIKLAGWARRIKRDAVALYLAARDPRVPWYAKALAACVAGYALSPIDLIPDFIPLLGYLDDLIILPLGILLAVRLIPADVLAELRDEAARRVARPTSRRAALIIVMIWLAAAAALIGLLWEVRQP